MLLIVIALRRPDHLALSPRGVGLAALQDVPGGARGSSLVLLALFMLSEAVLSVDRTGLPYFVVMVDDSASQQVVNQYADPKAKAAAAELAKIAGHPEADRLALAQGLLAKDDGAILRELQKKHRVRLYLVSNTARPLAEIDKPEDVAPALEKLKKVEASGDQSRLGSGVRQVLTELRGVPPTAIVLLTDGQTTEGETVARVAEFAARKGVPALPDRPGRPRGPPRPRTVRAAGRRRRLRRRPRPVPAQADLAGATPGRG